MPEGITAEVLGDGYATIQFDDPSLKAAALGRLLKIDPTGRTIQKRTREGNKIRWRVPEGNALAAGLLDVAGELHYGDQGSLGESDAAQRGTSPIGTPTARSSYLAVTPPDVHVGDHHISTTLAPKRSASSGRRKKPAPQLPTEPASEPAEKIDAPAAGLPDPTDF